MSQIKLAREATYCDSKNLAIGTTSDNKIKQTNKNKTMKLLQILNIMDIKEDQQVWSISFLTRKQD